MDTQIWFEIYSSRQNADDWFRHSAATYDTVEEARAALYQGGYVNGFDFKITKVTRTEEDVPLKAPAPPDWYSLGIELREATLDAHAGELIDSDNAYAFLLENPECFGREEWPSPMPQRPPTALLAGYHHMRFVEVGQ